MPAAKTKPMPKKSKRHFWSRNEKLEIVEHSEQFSIESALRKWNVSRSLVYRWGKMARVSKILLGDSSGRKRLGKKTSEVKHPEIESYAKKLFESYRSEHKAIPASVLQSKAKTYAKNIGSDIKCSNGWLESFLQRNMLTTRTKTSCKQRIPENFQELIQEFQKNYMKTLITEGITDRRRILNMDETPVCFDMPYKTTLEKKEPNPST